MNNKIKKGLSLLALLVTMPTILPITQFKAIAPVGGGADTNTTEIFPPSSQPANPSTETRKSSTSPTLESDVNGSKIQEEVTPENSKLTETVSSSESKSTLKGWQQVLIRVGVGAGAFLTLGSLYQLAKYIYSHYIKK